MAPAALWAWRTGERKWPSCRSETTLSPESEGREVSARPADKEVRTEALEQCLS